MKLVCPGNVPKSYQNKDMHDGLGAGNIFIKDLQWGVNLFFHGGHHKVPFREYFNSPVKLKIKLSGTTASKDENFASQRLVSAEHKQPKLGIRSVLHCRERDPGRS